MIERDLFFIIFALLYAVVLFVLVYSLFRFWRCSNRIHTNTLNRGITKKAKPKWK